MIEAIVVDLDGTLCDTSAIVHLVEGDDRDFPAFHRASIDAPAEQSVLAAVGDAHRAGRHVIVLTSREFIWRDLTLDWLAAHEVPYDQLLMRIVGDYRPDVTIKSELLDQAVADGYRLIEAWEDSDAVADMLVGRGVQVHRPPW